MTAADKQDDGSTAGDEKTCGAGAAAYPAQEAAPTAAHTPGPWRVRRTNTMHLIEADAFKRARGNRVAVAELQQWHVGYGPTGDDQAANARLIAAAPAMLEALRNIESDITTRMGPPSLATHGERLLAIVQIAIKRATEG